MVPISNPDQYERDIVAAERISDVLEVYADTLGEIRPSVFETLFDFNWGKFGINRDQHPTPMEHLAYIKKVCPEFLIDQNIENWVENEFQKSLRKFPNPKNPKFPAAYRNPRENTLWDPITRGQF